MKERPLFQMAFVFLLGILFGLQMKAAAVCGLAGMLIYLKVTDIGGRLQHAAGRAGVQCALEESMVQRRVGYGRGLSRFVWLILLVGCFVCSAGNTRHHLQIRENSLEKLDGNGNVLVRGEIYKKEYRNEKYYFYLKSCHVSAEKKSVPIHPLLVQFAEDAYSIGETLILNGQLHTFSPATNFGQFDRRDYYRSLNIDFYMRDPAVVAADHRENRFAERLYHFRERFAENLILLLGEEDGGVLSAMLLGEKSALNEEIKKEYQRSGIAHILAISGLHVSLIGMGLYKQLRKMRQSFWKAGILSCICLISYVLLTGFGVSSVRAAGMLILFWLAEALGRSYDTLNSLGAMAIVLLWQNPFLIGNTGFLFSFLAIMGVCAATVLFPVTEAQEKEETAGRFGKDKSANVREKNVSRVTQWKMAILCGLATSFSVWLFTAPVMAYSYYELPLYSMLVNLLVLPLVPLQLVSSMLSGCLSFVSMTIAGKAALPCRFILLWYHWLCNLTDRLPNSSWIVGKPESWRLCGYAGILLLLVLAGLRTRQRRMEEDEAIDPGEDVRKEDVTGYRDRACQKDVTGWQVGAGEEDATGQRDKTREEGASRRRRKLRSRLLMLGGIAGMFLILSVRIPSGSEVTILDVGQGDGIYLRTGGGSHIMIDGGSSNVSGVGTYRILPFLKAKGVSGISFWFISHADADHISGITEVLESGYPVQYLIFDRQIEKDAAFQKLAAAAGKYGTKVRFMDSGDSIRMGEAVFFCISPQERKESWDHNERSLVLLFEEGQFHAFFGGDISADVEQEMLAERILEHQAIMTEQGALAEQKFYFYKASHHGSKYSNSLPFLQQLSPRITVISCSTTNRYGHPHAETLKRLDAVGTDVFRTDQNGAVSIYIKDGRVVAKPYVN